MAKQLKLTFDDEGWYLNGKMLPDEICGALDLSCYWDGKSPSVGSWRHESMANVIHRLMIGRKGIWKNEVHGKLAKRFADSKIAERWNKKYTLDFGAWESK